MDWFKAYQDGILRGSLSKADDTVQLIWLKLLAIENETRQRDGWLHLAPGKPMTREYLAMICGVPTEQLDFALHEYLGDVDKDGHSRIEIAPDGDIFIKNWEKYQAKPEKTIAKEIAKEKRKATNRRKDAVVDRALELVNKLNARDKEYQFELLNDGRILNKKTGDIKTVDEMEQK